MEAMVKCVKCAENTIQLWYVYNTMARAGITQPPPYVPTQ